MLGGGWDVDTVVTGALPATPATPGLLIPPAPGLQPDYTNKQPIRFLSSLHFVNIHQSKSNGLILKA